MMTTLKNNYYNKCKTWVD